MLKLKYFILDPRSKKAKDPRAIASRGAMSRYAELIKRENPQLAEDLKVWVREEIEESLKFYGELGQEEPLTPEAIKALSYMHPGKIQEIPKEVFLEDEEKETEDVEPK